MLIGKSVFHVQQKEGRFYSKTDIAGYYNDLTNKVSDLTILDENGIPTNFTITGKKVNYPIAIFQYGLGLYDLYIETNDFKYLKKFKIISNWAIDNQKENGMWHCMDILEDKINKPQSAMCQGEAISLLLRAYVSFKDRIYLSAAKKAVEYMVKDVEKDGTLYIKDEEYILQEYVSKDNVSVLNGWIFAIFGLLDYCKISNEYKVLLENTLKTLCNVLPKYDRKYWSNYDIKGTIASPSYHELHISQLKVLYDIFEIPILKEYYLKWEKYQNNLINRYMAMLIKLFQKLYKNKYYDINTSIER